VQPLVKDRLDQPPLLHPELALVGQQPIAQEKLQVSILPPLGVALTVREYMLDDLRLIDIEVVIWAYAQA
jgi:hypothetical protein